MTVLSSAYPLDLSSGSIEQVNQSLAKIKNETTAIYGHLNSIRTRYRGATAPINPEAGMLWEDTVNNKIMKWNGSAWVQDIGVSINLTNRNTVLQGTVDGSGNPTLIAGDASDLTADLVATTETIIAIPAGHDATVGNLDYIVSFSATQTDFWTSLPANNTSYLFVDYAAGTVTGVYSVIAPVYQAYAPSHSAGKNWYDTNKEQWYLSDGSNWVAKYRGYVGSVVTDGTKVTATTIEPYNVIRSAVPMTYLDTDGTLAANLDTKIATQKAVKSYIDSKTNPPGSLLHIFYNASILEGYLACDGAAISRATYAALFSKIGTIYGAGNGSTTFNVPDMRGQFIRCLDNGVRTVGSAETDAFKSHYHTTSIQAYSSKSAYSGIGVVTADAVFATSTYNSDSVGGTETRPKNIALHTLIKY